MERVIILLEKIVSLLEAKPQPLLTVEQLQMVTAHFVAAKQTTGLKLLLKDLGVVALADLDKRETQNLFLSRAKELVAKLPQVNQKTVTEEIDKWLLK